MAKFLIALTTAVLGLCYFTYEPPSKPPPPEPPPPPITLYAPGEADAPEAMDGLQCLAFSPDSRLLASATFIGSLRVWDVAAGRELLRAALPDGRVHAVAFTANDRLVLVGGRRVVEVPLLSRGRSVETSGPVAGYFAVAIAPDGRGALITTDDTYVVDLRTRRVLARAADRGLAFALSDDLAYMAGCRSDKDGAYLLATAEGKERRVGDPQAVSALAFSADGSLLAIGERGQVITLVQTRTGTVVRHIRLGPYEHVSRVAFSRSGERLYATVGQEIACWKVADARKIWSKELKPGDGTEALVVSPDDKQVATGGVMSPRPLVFDARDGTSILR